ncbi:hypothetical protein RHGRI_034696 [Rhododendron griersonianum]|uniref:NmrA-like domain-containing protein n=1 Tax=Rhododendron griersonianum TaxID=479676 RepID=A0AAV6I1M7_9ERIC|nr:hypothetical protein RHGRI_034696 [Rhododendron griersonianum]
MTVHAPVAAKGRTLVVGSTGFIGRFVAEASLASGRPTFLLVRPGPASTSKALTGSIRDRDSLGKVLKEYEIEVVISAVGGGCILDQLVLVDAIKGAGTVKRFLPSEFGHEIDRADPVEPGLTMYIQKRQVRRAIEAAGIPYTYICCNSIAAWPYHDNTHPADVLPPLDRDADIEVTSLYPDASFRSIDECFDDFLARFTGGCRR